MADRLPEAVEVASGRLVIRRWRVADAPTLRQAVIDSVEHLRPWMPWAADEPLTLDQRVELIYRWDADFADDQGAVYGVLLPDGTVVGGTGLHRRTAGRPDVLEIGYWVHVDYAGQGIATETAEALTEAAFALPGTTAVEIAHLPDNHASQAVPRKLGYRRKGERTEPGTGRTLLVWVVERTEWVNRARPRSTSCSPVGSPKG